MKIKFGLVNVIFTLFLFTSCGTDAPKESQDEVVSTEENQELQVEETEEFILPSTVQIGDLFRNSGLEYVAGLTLDPQKSTSYNTSFDKYFAFGAYWTDMTYCILNQQTQEARKYMAVIKTISEELGAGEVFNDKEMLERFNNNLDNNDSILMILIEIDERTDRYVEDNNESEFALVAFVGGWVEGMYLGVSTASFETHTKLTGRIVEQMVILDRLIAGLSKYEGESQRTDLVLAEMKSLYDFYINIPEIANPDMDAETNISTTDMILLGDKILTLRDLIVE